MPTVILQIPSVRVIISHELSNEHHIGPNNRCNHCGRRQSEDKEIKEHAVYEDDIKNGNIKVEDIKEEMVFKYPFDEQNYSNMFRSPDYVKFNESPLSPLPEENTKDEVYDWKPFLIE